MPVTTFLAVASKAGGFGALLRFFGMLFVAPGVTRRWPSTAIRSSPVGPRRGRDHDAGQSGGGPAGSVKRMLAYSSVAHAGYAGRPAAMNVAGLQAAMFYLAAYYFMNLGAFGFLLYFTGVTGRDLRLLRGMGPRPR